MTALKCECRADDPVIAAGGVGDGRGLAAALALGAEGTVIDILISFSVIKFIVL